MVPRKNMEPSEGALLLSGMTKTEGFQFSHAHNYEHFMAMEEFFSLNGVAVWKSERHERPFLDIKSVSRIILCSQTKLSAFSVINCY